MRGEISEISDGCNGKVSLLLKFEMWVELEGKFGDLVD
jgi:hypothetical protein